MKWSLQQLHKISKFPYEFDEVLDFNQEIKDIEDIYEISPVNITGRISPVDEGTYRLNYHVECTLTLQCALTLDPVSYHYETDYEETLSVFPDDDCILIEKNTIDTHPIVWSNLIIDKPLNVTRPDAYEVLKERGISLNEEPELDDDDMVIYFSDGRKSEDD